MMQRIPSFGSLLLPCCDGSLRLLVLIVLMGFTIGCSDSGPRLFEATGKLTLNDKPLANASIIFSPAEQSPTVLLATGRTDAEGAFALITDLRPGATAGKYTVTISATEEIAAAPKSQSKNKENSSMLREGDMPKPTKSLIPLKYTKLEESGLSFTVDAAGKNQFEIKLTGSPPK